MKNRIFYLFTMLIFMISCTTDPLNIDVSSVDFDIEHIDIVKAYDASGNLESLAKVNSELNASCTELYEFYTAEMLRVGMPLQDSTPFFIGRFLADSTMQLVNRKIATKFNGFNSYLPKVADMFKHLKYHVPKAILPSKIVTYNSTFSNGVISTPNFIGVGLEMYLGPEDDIVKKVPFPQYFKAKMNPEYLLPDICQSWLEYNVLEGVTEESFLANLIYYGKVLYTIKAMLPATADRAILRYSESDLLWAQENEYAVWQYIVQNNMVYDTKMKTMLRYFKPAPTTVGFDGSPDRIGQYLGYQIISAYMNKNNEVSLKALIAEKNSTKILKSYKPKE
ncbi:MAG: hypothetical protein R3279_08990 [Putridiphycobacter sp.]|nr:hypothetical protein [Putridiphycobacter sp.]